MAAQNVVGTAFSSSSTTETPANTNLGTQTNGPISYSTAFSNGAAADQIQQIAYGTLSLAAAAQTIDLTALTDPQGNAVSFTAVKRIRLYPKTTTDGQILTLAPGATNPWLSLIGTSTGTLILQSSSAKNKAWLEIVAPNTTGYAVSSTNKTLSFNPGTATVGVDYEIFGI
ncbi:MAG: hypothetical protein NVSMB14_13390 [Isosphaeraceae bacterium]